MKSINDKATRWQGGGGRPLRGGAWIEITPCWKKLRVSQSPPSRGAWIEILKSQAISRRNGSPPSRGAWIEIVAIVHKANIPTVAPFAGGVD